LGYGHLEDLPVILIVEDDQAIRSLVEETLSNRGFGPVMAPSRTEALTLLEGARLNIARL